MSRDMRKSVFGVPDQVRHKPGCTTAEDSRRLEISCSVNKGADQLHSHCAADLCLCFRICKKAGFLMTRLIFQDTHI